MLRVVLNAWVTKTTAAQNSGESRDPKASSHDDHQFEIPRANRPSFPDDKNPRNSGRLTRRATVCEPNSDRSPAVCAQYHPPVSACKIPFPELHNGSGWRTTGTPTWRQQAVEDSVDQPCAGRRMTGPSICPLRLG